MSRWSTSSKWTVLGLVGALASATGDATAAEPFELTNLDFEAGAAEWSYHLGERGVALKAVAERADVSALPADLVVAGASQDQSKGLVLSPTSSKAPVLAFQCSDARDVRGKRLILGADMSEEDAEGVLFVVQSRRNMLMDQSLTNRNKKMDGYARTGISAEISSAASEVCVGVMAWGTGTVTVDNLKFSVRDDGAYKDELRSSKDDDAEATPVENLSYGMVKVAAGKVELDVTVQTKSKSWKKRYKDLLKSFSEEQEVEEFMMGTHEVTRGQWLELMERSQWSEVDHCVVYGDEDATLPVECVSLSAVMVYANRLSVRDGLAPVYSWKDDKPAADEYATGYRLPTAAEWYLALGEGGADVGGDVCAEANVYDSARQQVREPKPDQSFDCDDGSAEAAPVGARAANALGIFDLQGNVREYVWTENGDGALITRAIAGLGYRSDRKAVSGLVATTSSRLEGVGFRLARRIPVEAEDVQGDAEEAADEPASETPAEEGAADETASDESTTEE